VAVVKEPIVLLFAILAFSGGAIFGTFNGRSSADDSMARTWSALSASCRAEIEAAALDEGLQGKRRE